MTHIDFFNDDRFSIAPPWIVEQLTDVPFFSISEDDDQSFHAVMVLKDGQKVGVPIYGRKWIKFSEQDLQQVTELLQIIALNERGSSRRFENGTGYKNRSGSE